MTQHSVFLIDDEQLIVEGLRASIEKGMTGFYCIGTALSGEAALEQVLRLKPEIVISDIRMGEMSGLELARNLRQLLPFTKVILLSGYDDFPYAQSAIRNQVFDYLLKPITDHLLLQVLQRAASSLNDQLMEKRRMAEITRYLDNSRPFLRHLLFSELRAPVVSPDNAVIQLFGMETNEVYLPVYIRFVDSVDFELAYESDRQLLLFEQVRYIFEDLGIRVIPFFERVAFVLLMRFDRAEDALDCESRAYLALEKIASMIALNREGAFCIGVGPLAYTFQDIRNAHEKAKEASRYYFHFGSGSVVSYNDIAFSASGENESKSWIQQVVLAIRAGAQETALNLLHEYTNSFYKRDDSITSIRHSCLQVYLTLWQEFGQECFPSQAPEGYLNTAISSLFSCPDIHALDNLLTAFISQINEALSGRLLTRNQQIVQQITEIIDREYATATLETISSMVHLSPAYTSNLFSNTCGTTIREYIIAKRIERSKELLKETDMKLYEIADVVGYSDPKYFSQLFRKLTGQTPNQYRYR